MTRSTIQDLRFTPLRLAMLAALLTIGFTSALSATSHGSSIPRLPLCGPEGGVVQYDAVITGPAIPWKAVPATRTSASIMWGSLVPQNPASDASGNSDPFHGRVGWSTEPAGFFTAAITLTLPS